MMKPTREEIERWLMAQKKLTCQSMKDMKEYFLFEYTSEIKQDFRAALAIIESLLEMVRGGEG